MSLTQNASKNIVDRLTWHTANRDQTGIAKDLAEGKDIPEVYGLGKLDYSMSFFTFLIISNLPTCSWNLNQNQNKETVRSHSCVSFLFI